MCFSLFGLVCLPVCSRFHFRACECLCVCVCACLRVCVLASLLVSCCLLVVSLCGLCFVVFDMFAVRAWLFCIVSFVLLVW